MRNLILLHGALGHTDHFRPYLSWLQQYFHVYTFLFKGHGDTAIPHEGISMQGYINQLHTFIREKELQECEVFGYSMGGYVALSYALQYPGTIRSLLTLATKLQWTEEVAIKESRMLHPETITEKVPRYAAQLAALHGADKWQQLLPAVAASMIALGRDPLLTPDKYSAIDMKVLLTMGDKDVMVTLEETAAAAKAIPGASLGVLPDTKHPLDQVRSPLLMAFMKDFWAL